MILSPTIGLSQALPTLFVPVLTAEQLAGRNAAVIALLDEWEADAESEQDQRDTMDVLRRTLGPERVGSDRPAILP